MTRDREKRRASQRRPAPEGDVRRKKGRGSSKVVAAGLGVAVLGSMTGVRPARSAQPAGQDPGIARPHGGSSVVPGGAGGLCTSGKPAPGGSGGLAGFQPAAYDRRLPGSSGSQFAGSQHWTPVRKAPLPGGGTLNAVHLPLSAKALPPSGER